MAELIGVTYQQAHKYEKGINRVAAGRLYSIAQGLGVQVSYFFEGLDTAGRFVPSPQQFMLLDLTRDYVNIPVRNIGRQSSRLLERSPNARTGTSRPREVLVVDRFGRNAAGEQRKVLSAPAASIQPQVSPKRVRLSDRCSGDSAQHHRRIALTIRATRTCASTDSPARPNQTDVCYQTRTYLMPRPGRPRQIDMLAGICAKRKRWPRSVCSKPPPRKGGRHRLTRPPSLILF
jgi:transcriptional regulator with XRE-family HTH domain